MEAPTTEEITSLVARLNFELMKAQSEVTALRSTLCGYLASKGEREDALDEIIAKGAATFLDLKLEQAEKMSPGAAAVIDQRTPEDLSWINFDALEEIKRREQL